MLINRIEKSDVFAQDITLDEVRNIVEKLPQFNERRKDGLIIMNYRMGNVGTFPNPFTESKNDEEKREFKIRRELRGFIFGEKSGQLLCRPFHKFFNINELDETDEKNIDLSTPYVVLHKLDGFFVYPIIDDQGNFHFCTKTGHANKKIRIVSRFLSQSKQNEKYEKFCRKFIEKGFTCIFEHIDSSKSVVISYKKTMLVLLAIRNVKTGEYLPLSHLEKEANEFDIPVVPQWKMDPIPKSVRELIDLCRIQKDKEGFCLQFENGSIFKIKTLFYMKSGKGDADLPISELKVWRIILNDTVDDHKSMFAKKVLKQRIERFQNDIFQKLKILSEVTIGLQEESKEKEEEAEGENENDEIKKNSFVDGLKDDEMFKKLRFQMKKNESLEDDMKLDPFDLVRNFVLRNLRNRSGLNNIRPLFGGIFFYD